jgi:hypothetical protein
MVNVQVSTISTAWDCYLFIYYLLDTNIIAGLILVWSALHRIGLNDGRGSFSFIPLQPSNLTLTLASRLTGRTHTNEHYDVMLSPCPFSSTFSPPSRLFSYLSSHHRTSSFRVYYLCLPGANRVMLYIPILL